MRLAVKLLGKRNAVKAADYAARFASKAARFAERNAPGAGFFEKDIQQLADLRAKWNTQPLTYDHLAFLRLGHIGSWSFWDSIAQLFPKEQMFSIDWRPQDVDNGIRYLESMSEAQKKALRLIALHAPCPVHRYLPGRTSYFTLLRNPVKVTISHYFWQYNHRHDVTADWVSPEVRAGQPLGEWIKSFPDNISSRWVMATVGEVFPESLPEAEAIQRCIEVMKQRYCFIGITEKFSESLFLCALITQSRRIPLWRHLGQSNAPVMSDLNSDILRDIEQKSRIDKGVYEYWRAMFNQKYQEELTFFDRYINTLESSKK
jgi:hypothetical protein